MTPAPVVTAKTPPAAATGTATSTSASSSTAAPISAISPSPTSLAGVELTDATKIFHFDVSTHPLRVVLLKPVNPAPTALDFQGGQWTGDVDFSKDYCEVGGAGTSINESQGASDYVVFVDSIQDANEIRVGLPGTAIKSFVLIACELTSTSPQSLTYGQWKTLTGGQFKLVYE